MGFCLCLFLQQSKMMLDFNKYIFLNFIFASWVASILSLDWQLSKTACLGRGGIGTSRKAPTSFLLLEFLPAFLSHSEVVLEMFSSQLAIGQPWVHFQNSPLHPKWDFPQTVLWLELEVLWDDVVVISVWEINFQNKSFHLQLRMWIRMWNFWKKPL